MLYFTSNLTDCKVGTLLEYQWQKS